MRTPPQAVRRVLGAARLHIEAVICALVLTAAIYSMLPTLKQVATGWNTAVKPSWQGDRPESPRVNERARDTDALSIHRHLLAAPRFRDTFRWWTGAWAHDSCYYRPVSSLIFWVEWKLFGNFELRYALLNLIVHALAVWNVCRLASELSRAYRVGLPPVAALLAGIMFVWGGAVFPVRSGTNSEVFTLWKNIPDTLCLLFVCLCVRDYLRLLPSGASIGAGVGRLARARALSMLWFLLALMVKEAGAFTPLALIGLEGPALLARDASIRREAWMRLRPFLVALPLYLAWRTWRLAGFHPEVQPRLKPGWPHKAALTLLGPFSEALNYNTGFPAINAAWIAGLMAAAPFLRRRRLAFWIVAALLAALLLLCGLDAMPAVTSSDSPLQRWVIGVYMSFTASASTHELSTCLFLLGMGYTVCRAPGVALFAFIWSVIGLFLLLPLPETLFRLYLPQTGYILGIAVGLSAWLADLCRPAQPVPAQTPLEAT